jgi:hypothetical protein
VHFVTRKFVRLTLNAKTQFRVLLRYGKQSVSRDRDLYYVITGGQSAVPCWACIGRRMDNREG